MADVTGELGGQPILLENAATEATLYALLQATLANSSKRSEAAKIQQAYEEALKATTKKQKENKEKLEEEAKKRADLNKQIAEEKERREKMLKGMSEAATALRNLGQSIGNLIGGLMDAAFSSATPKVTDFTNALSGIPIIGPIIGAVGKAMQDTIDKFRDLSSVGADFGRGIHTMRTMATQAGLSLETYSKTIVENGRNLALLGGHTAAGAKIFTAVNASMKGQFATGLARLGFSMEEQAEYTAGYLEQQTKLGRAQRMTQAELNEGAKEYLLELDMLARVHGMTRKEAQKALDQQMSDKRLQLFYAQLGNSNSVMKSFLASIPDEQKEFRDAMADLIMNKGVASANNEMAKEISRNNPLLRDLAVRLSAGIATQDDVNSTMQAQARISKEFGENQGKNASMLLNLTGTYGSVHAAMMGFENYGKGTKPAADAQRTAMNDTTKNMANLDRAILDLRNQLMNALMPMFITFTEKIIEAIPALTKFIEELTRIAGEEGFSGAIKHVFSTIGGLIGPALIEMLKGIFTSPAVIGAVIMGIVGLWAYAAIKMALAKAIVDAFDGAKPKGPKPGQYGNWGDMKPQGPTSELPKKPGMMSRAVGLLKGGGFLSLGGMAVEYAGEKVAEAGHTKTGAALDIAGSTAKYAGMGAMAGSFIPGLGTVVGGGIGALFGLGAGLYESGGKLFGGGKKPEQPPENKDMKELAKKLQEGKISQDEFQKRQAELLKNSGAGTAAVPPADPKADKNQSPDLKVAAQVAKTTTAKEVKELATALKELDYSKLIIPDTAHTTMEQGALKMRQLRGEVNALSTSFKELDNTGLNKITEGLGRLDASFKSFNKSFVDNFMTKFKELDKKTQEALLTDLNTKMDLLNTSVQSLVELEQGNSRHHASTARNTKSTSGRVN